MAIRQGKAMTVDRLLLIGEIAENNWLKSNSKEEKKELDSTIEFTTIEFFVLLCAEEVPLIVIEGLKMLWMETRNHRIPHMRMTLRGRFKGGNNLRWNCILLADQTKSGIPTRRWISLILYCRFEL